MMQRSEGALAPRTKCDLGTRRQRLVELLQEVRFGRIEDLAVRDGEPVWTPPPRVLRDVRFGKASGPHPMRDTQDFALRREVVELFEFFDREQTADIALLEVHHGLPHRMVVATEARP